MGVRQDSLRLPRVFDDTYATFSTPVSTIRLTMNALSSVSGKVTATILQAGHRMTACADGASAEISSSPLSIHP
jgi:hypothetical protein